MLTARKPPYKDLFLLRTDLFDMFHFYRDRISCLALEILLNLLQLLVIQVCEVFDASLIELKVVLHFHLIEEGPQAVLNLHVVALVL